MAAAPHETHPTSTAERGETPLDRHTGPDAGTTSRERPGRALWAVITGALGVVGALIIPLLGLALGIVATVLGVTARNDIRRNHLDGHGQATAGMVLGIVAIVLAIALMILGAIIVLS